MEADELAPARSDDVDAALELRALVRRLSARLPGETVQAGLLVRGNGMTQLELAHALAVSERTDRRRLADFDAAAATLSREERA